MKRSLIVPALLSIVISACDKETPNPVIAVDVVTSVSRGASGVVTIPVGGTVQLTANPRGGGGVVLTDRPVTWSSSNAAVAQVNPTTGTVTTVTGVASGTATITAQSEDARGTVDVAVEAPVSTGCQEGSTFLNLRVGEVFTATGPAASIVCLNGGSGSEYTYIPFFASEAGSARLALEVNAGGIGAATGPPNPSLAPGLATLNQASAGGSISLDENFERRLREKEIRELTPLIPSARAAALHRSGGALRNLVQAIPVEGDLLTLNANANSGCTNPDNRVGRVVAITQRAIVVVDTANPQNAGISDEEYRSFGVAFDTLAYPVNVENFGEPSDIDNNGKVLIFYTRAVNELTPEKNPSFIGGFFFGRDLFPRQARGNLGACASSNEREMFYMLAPDPEGVVNNNKRPADLIRRSTVGTIAHEFQHLINQSRRLYVNTGAAPFEEVWLNEGLSHIAEELAFYRVSRLAPRQNITIETIRSSNQVVDAFNRYAISNFGRFISYLQRPDTASLLGVDNLPTRGASWAFLRYAADRKAGPDQPFWFALVNSRTRGVANLRNALATEPINWMQDWTVSVYTDDTDLPVEGRFTQPSWNFRSIMPAFTSTNNRYPLQTIALTTSSAVNLNLFGGGAAYLRFGVAPSGRAGIRVTSGGVTPPANLRISIVRTK
ncbi:MAG: Ig-like domain-containing protein [Gemmatimonadetes bacterium]|nr:Ig-like domain-containing protein [Gemmatimonadota bacterium]